MIMKNTIKFIMTLILLVFSNLLYASDNSFNLESLLPVKAGGDWRLEGSPQKAEGMNLFMLINGGAELYLHNGFKRALIATLLDRQGKPFNMDIYQMNSAEIAKKTNKEKIGEGAERISIANDARFEGYYLNFWKGPYQVTVSASYESEAFQSGIKKLAEIIAGNIPD